MARSDPDMRAPGGTTYCDVTQSWSDVGGGVGTYLRHKRAHILEHCEGARHVMIVPGPRDETVVENDGRAVTVFVASPRVPGSPHYRLLLRNRAVRAALERYRPDLIECQDAYNLPWAAIAFARRRPTALVAAYMTDFPTTYVERPFGRFVGKTVAGAAARLCYRYCGALYRRFDAVYALSEHGGAAKLRGLGVDDVAVVPLGVELGQFSPAKRDPGLRRRLGLGNGQPLLIYAGRLDVEKRPQTVVEAFLNLPLGLGAKLVLLGDGPLRQPLLDQVAAAGAADRVHAPGYVRDRGELARWLASADLYVSGMADETFGISIIEAQASGLPVIGVAAGAMVDRVPAALGRIGPIDDPAAMAAHILDVWRGDPAAMGARARVHAEQFSWAESMARLFGGIYVTAMRTAALRAGRAGVSETAPVVAAR
jgi:alpha-1,6-mannosyltransferase